MDLPLYQIRTLIKTRQIADIKEIFDFGSVEQWKDLLGFRRDMIRRMSDGSQRWRWVHAHLIAKALECEYNEIEDLVPDSQWVKPATEKRSQKLSRLR